MASERAETAAPVVDRCGSAWTSWRDFPLVIVKVPPLRERGEDIILVAKDFLDKYGVEHAKPGLTFAPDALPRTPCDATEGRSLPPPWNLASAGRLCMN